MSAAPANDDAPPLLLLYNAAIGAGRDALNIAESVLATIHGVAMTPAAARAIAARLRACAERLDNVASECERPISPCCMERDSPS